MEVTSVTALNTLQCHTDTDLNILLELDNNSFQINID